MSRKKNQTKTSLIRSSPKRSHRRSCGSVYRAKRLPTLRVGVLASSSVPCHGPSRKRVKPRESSWPYECESECGTKRREPDSDGLRVCYATPTGIVVSSCVRWLAHDALVLWAPPVLGAARDRERARRLTRGKATWGVASEGEWEGGGSSETGRKGGRERGGRKSVLRGEGQERIKEEESARPSSERGEAREGATQARVRASEKGSASKRERERQVEREGKRKRDGVRWSARESAVAEGERGRDERGGRWGARRLRGGRGERGKKVGRSDRARRERGRKERVAGGGI
eukprot:6214557-Pleurochrysis_carterae.AAC.5